MGAAAAWWVAIGVAMFGCCLSEGMRALYTTWSNIVTAGSNGVYVHL